MLANMDGTEIRDAIEEAFKSRSNLATPASIFVLTDGAAHDLNGVQGAVSAAIAKAKVHNVLLRLFCLDIGNPVSKVIFNIYCDRTSS